jgi:hypothetical protein
MDVGGDLSWIIQSLNNNLNYLMFLSLDYPFIYVFNNVCWENLGKIARTSLLHVQGWKKWGKEVI